METIYAQALDNMFDEDEKKKISAIKKLRAISQMLGPQRVKNQFVPMLFQMLDQQPSILSLLLAQLVDFDRYTGGEGTDEILIPFLIQCCCLDEISISYQAFEIMKNILSFNLNLYKQTIASLLQNSMSTCIEIGLKLINQGIKKLNHLQKEFLSIYKTYLQHTNPIYRILAAKYFQVFVQNMKNKDHQLIQIFSKIVSDKQDLPKLYIIKPLLSIYSSYSVQVIKLLQKLIRTKNWRYYFKICEYAPIFKQKLSIEHFKNNLQPLYIQILQSQSLQIRQVGIKLLPILASVMSQSECITKLIPIIRSLSQNQQNYKALSRNIVNLFKNFTNQQLLSQLMSITLTLIKQNNLQISIGIIRHFTELIQYFSIEQIQNNVLIPIKSQLNVKNWRLKVQFLEIIRIIIKNRHFLSPTIVSILFKEVQGHIEKLRAAASEIISIILADHNSNWCQKYIFPKILSMKQHKNYLIRRQVIRIIDKTLEMNKDQHADCFGLIIEEMVEDKVANVRLEIIELIVNKKNQRIFKDVVKKVSKLKNDNDVQVRQKCKLIQSS